MVEMPILQSDKSFSVKSPAEFKQIRNVRACVRVRTPRVRVHQNMIQNGTLESAGTRGLAAISSPPSHETLPEPLNETVRAACKAGKLVVNIMPSWAQGRVWYYTIA